MGAIGEGCERTRETEATALVSHRDVSHCLAPYHCTRKCTTRARYARERVRGEPPLVSELSDTHERNREECVASSTSRLALRFNPPFHFHFFLERTRTTHTRL